MIFHSALVADLTHYLIKLNEVLGKQNEWLAELSRVINESNDDDYERERQEFDEHLDPINKIRKEKRKK
jgi:hypothetical protein